LYRPDAGSAEDLPILFMPITDRFSFSGCKPVSRDGRMPDGEAKTKSTYMSIQYHWPRLVWSAEKAVKEIFSLCDVRVLFFNKMLTELIFSNLTLDINCKKYRSLFIKCFDIGRLPC
jgi:hypothetical protein